MRRGTRAALALVLAAVAASALAGSAHRATAAAAVVREHASPGVVRQGTAPALTAAAKRLLARALQASGNSNFVCSPAAPGTNQSTQTCKIVGNSGVCIERSTNPTATQSCEFTQVQANPGKANIAIAVQVIEQRDMSQAGQKEQHGTQTITVNQTNGSGWNFNWSTQIVKQFLGKGADQRDDEESQEQRRDSDQQRQGTPADLTSLIQSLDGSESAQENAASSWSVPSVTLPAQQIQQGDQKITVCQGGAPNPCADSSSGNNANGNYQSLRQWEWAAKNSISVDQQQNPMQGTCEESGSSSLNMCSVVNQHSNGGKNLSGLFEFYRQFQFVKNTPIATQKQDAGEDLGGLGHDIFQFSDPLHPDGPQRQWILTGQRARQTQIANGVTTTPGQTQDPRADKGSASVQEGTTHDTWRGWMKSDQRQFTNGALTNPANQAQRLTYSGTSSGDIIATVSGSNNDDSATDQCFPGDTGDVCNAGVECYSGGGTGDCFAVSEETSSASTRRPN